MSLSYPNAFLLPCHGAEKTPLFAERTTGGVYDQNKAPIEHGFLIRQYRKDAVIKNGVWDRKTGTEYQTSRMILPREPEAHSEHLSGEFIFAGYLFEHYGHFLLESLSRLWFIKENPEKPLLWLGVHNQSQFNDMQREFFELYNVTNPMHILTGQTQVDSLIVPEDGYIIHTRYTRKQMDALRLSGPKPTVSGKKVWVSRSKLKTGIVFNEHAFEHILMENGWTIFHPQDYSIQAQVDMFADAEEIAGIEGSGLHTLMLTPDTKAKVTIFARRELVNLDFAVIGEELGLNQRVLPPARIQWSAGLAEWESNYVWINYDVPIKTLELARTSKSPKPISKSLENVVSSIADYYRPRNFVELWPKYNTVSTYAGKATKVIVNELLEFDLRRAQNLGLHLFEITPEQYLTTRPATTSIEAFCIRPHNDFDQLLRAFNASLCLSNAKSIWILEGGTNELADSKIEKLIAHIHDFYPVLSIARVGYSDIAVVWVRRRHMVQSEMSKLPNLDDDNFTAPLSRYKLNSIAERINQTRDELKKN